MLKKIAAAVASVAILCGFSGCSLTAQNLIDKEYTLDVPVNMVFLGDSIAAGYGLDGYTSTDNYNCDSYSNLLKNQYKQELAEICEPEMYNFAVSGSTSQDLLDLIDSGDIDSELKKADVIVISTGGNDMLHKMYSLLADLGMSEENSEFNFDNLNIPSAFSKLITLDDDIDEALDGFEVNVCEIADKLQEKSDGDIYIQTLYNPFESLTSIKPLVELSEKNIKRFNEIVRDNDEKYTVIDIEEQFKDKTEKLTRIKKMDIHPNAKGHKLIAEIVDKAFREKKYTYITQEYGEPYLTGLAYVLIFVGAALAVLVLIIIPKLFEKHEKR